MQSKRTHLESLRGQRPEGCRKSWNVFILTYANPSDPSILSFILCNVNDHITSAKNYEIEGYNDITSRIVVALSTDSFKLSNS